MCRQRDDLISCVGGTSFQQRDTISWEIRSTRADTVFFDTCSTSLARDLGPSAGFDVEYLPTLGCGSGAGREEVRLNMIVLFPGDIVTGEWVTGDLTPQGRYRMNLWVVDETGRRISEGPYFTPPFSLFPDQQ